MSWLKTEDGRLALESLRDFPEALQVINAAATDHLKMLEERLLGMNISDASKDRVFIMAKAELDGANGMVRYIKQVLQGETEHKQRKHSNG